MSNAETDLTPEQLARLQVYLPERIKREMKPDPALWTPEEVSRYLTHLGCVLRTASTYVPRHLAQAVLSHPAPHRVHGEFVTGTLLFSDISGFTAMSERLSTLSKAGAEEITDVVNGYFRTMLDVIFAYGGVLLKFGGDAMLCLFAGGENSAARAVRAALDMQAAMGQFAQVQTSQGTFPLRMKIGLNTGPIFAASLGSADNMEYVVMGHEVNRTAHAESAAEAGQVLISDHTRRALEGVVTVREVRAGFHQVVDIAAGRPVEDRGEWAIADPVAGEGQAGRLWPTVVKLEALTPYLAPGLLDKIVYDPEREEVEGEYVLATVVFANFEGFSEVIEALGPGRTEEITQLVNRYFLAMQDVVHRYEGAVNKVDLYDHGDKLMVVFGAPKAHEDDVERAVRAAFEMQEAMKGLEELETTAGRFPLRQRIGISTGFVFAGNVGSPRRKEYTVMGDEVNLGARLMSAAQAGQLLVSGYVQRRVRPFFELRARGEVALKGKSQPVPIFQVVGVKAEPEPVRGIRGLYSEVVGRAEEMAAMRACLERVLAGQGQIMSVVGEAGLGKTRLVAELRRVARDRELTWLETHCLSYGRSFSYWMFAEIVKKCLGMAPSDSQPERWARLRRVVGELFPPPEGREVLPYLAHFLSLPLAGELYERVRYLDSEALRRQIFIAVRSFLRRLAERQPLVLVFDDMHWADDTSVDLLEQVLALTAQVPLMLCLVYRPDKEAGCWRIKEVAARDFPDRNAEIALEPLPTGDSAQLVGNLLAIVDFPDELREFIVGKGEGNPFYVEEVIRSLIDGQVLIRDGSRWRMSKEVGEFDVPDTLEGVIRARIDRLDEGPRQTVRVASVIGDEFLYHVLAHLDSGQHLDYRLTELQRRELIAEKQRQPELEYNFKSLLTREVAYDSLLARIRKAYHRRVGQYVEGLYRGRKLEEHYELLAHHYYLGEDWPKALAYLMRAGDKSKRAYANQLAIDFYRKADEIAHRLGCEAEEVAIHESLGDVYFLVGEYEPAMASYQDALGRSREVRKRADIRRRMGEIHAKRGEYEAALRCFEAGRGELSEEHGETVEMARIFSSMSSVYESQGEHDQARDYSLRGLELLEGTQHYGDVAQAYNTLGHAYRLISDWDQAREYFQKSLEIMERIGDIDGIARLYNNLAIVSYFQGELDQATAYFQHCLETKQKIGDVWGVAAAQKNIGVIRYSKGEYEKAVEYYQRSLVTLEKLGESRGVAGCYLNLGETYRAMGEPGEAIKQLRKSLELALEIGAKRIVPEVYRQLGESYLQDGDVARALEFSSKALESAIEIGDKNEEAASHRVLGNTYRQLEKWHAMEQHFEAGIHILEELKNERDLGLTRYEYALALRDEGQVNGAERELRQALALFETLGLANELEKAQQALASLKSNTRE